jgi:transcriptional regulator with XRE-family HTH domain
MASPRGEREEARSKAFGALVRSLRRERKWTLDFLAQRIPMSPSNLSRMETGNQGPPADEVIEKIAEALGADTGAMMRAAGRTKDGKAFEDAVLERLDALSRDVAELKSTVSHLKPRP